MPDTLPATAETGPQSQCRLRPAGKKMGVKARQAWGGGLVHPASFALEARYFWQPKTIGILQPPAHCLHCGNHYLPLPARAAHRGGYLDL